MTVTGILLALALVGAPLFVIVGLVTGASFMAYTDEVKTLGDLAVLIEPLEDLLGRDPFLAIPLFIASGAIMTAGGLAQRLVDIARAAVGFLPGGLGVSAVAACMGFAAISGSSPVTLIAVGSIMYPAMVKAKYPDNFSLGLVMTAGALGCLVMPALVLLIYAIAVSMTGNASVDPSDMFIAALVPATGIALILALYSIWVGRTIPGERETFSWARLWRALVDGIWALLLPIIVLGGILGGFFPPYQAGAVAVIYALVVTLFIYRELDLKGVILELAKAGKLMGMLILIIGLAFGLNEFLAVIKVEDYLVEQIQSWNLGPFGFLLLVNVILIVLGALMDSISATLIFAPILAPIAVEHYGMDPLHFGVVFVVNMEIGYLAPPVATNLFVAAALFKKPFGQVCRAVLPGLTLTCVALFVFMYVPTCSKGLINYKRGMDVYEPFPWDGKPAEQVEGSQLAPDLGKLSTEAMEDSADPDEDEPQDGDETTVDGDEAAPGSGDAPSSTDNEWGVPL